MTKFWDISYYKIALHEAQQRTQKENYIRSPLMRYLVNSTKEYNI